MFLGRKGEGDENETKASGSEDDDDGDGDRKKKQGRPRSNSSTSTSLLLLHSNSTQLKYPNLLERFDAFVASLKGKRLALFLDYDGTLTPIVRDPDRAFLSDATRSAVRAAAAAFPAAIVSGRGREKVEQFVKLPELYYAGSHGMDIVGSAVSSGGSSGSGEGGGGGGGQNGEETSTSAAGGGGSPPSTAATATRGIAFQPAAEFAPVMDALYASLEKSLVGIPGSSVEHNTFCVSVRGVFPPPFFFELEFERRRKKKKKTPFLFSLVSLLFPISARLRVC